MEQRMKTITMQTQIAADGKLCFELSTDLPPGPAEVVVIVQPSAPAPARSTVSLSGRFPVVATADDGVVDYIRQLRRETTEASWELTE
jgi:hypothetical protein